MTRYSLVTPKRPRCDLLDGAAAEIAVVVGGEAAGILAALSGVAAATDAVHGDGERLVGLGADRAERHRPGGEAGEDAGDRLDLLDGNGLAVGAELHEAAEGGHLAGLVVHEGGVLAEDLAALRPGGVLELEDRVGVEEVVLAVVAPLVLAPHPMP